MSKLLTASVKNIRVTAKTLNAKTTFRVFNSEENVESNVTGTASMNVAAVVRAVHQVASRWSPRSVLQASESGGGGVAPASPRQVFPPSSRQFVFLSWLLR